MEFINRKIAGNVAENSFEELCPDAIRLSKYAKNDFTYHEDPIHIRFLPDYLYGSDFVEVKIKGKYNLCNWNKAECDYQKRVFGEKLYLWVEGVWYRMDELRFTYKSGSQFGSGQPYYMVNKLKSFKNKTIKFTQN